MMIGVVPALRAQVLVDMSRQSINDRSVITTMEEGTLDGNEYGASGIIDNWNNILKDFEKFEDKKEIEAKAANFDKGDIRQFVRPDGRMINLPQIFDENGVDLFVLTTEGIYLYLAMSNPVYHQEPDDDIIKWIRYYAYEKRKYTQRIFARYQKWEPLIKQYFATKGIPEELAELCLIESGCTYGAVSPVGATGMWQIMPETGRAYGLVINSERDDRRDPVLSTQAAADILLANYRRVGEWTLAAAAYNCGSGRILRHIGRGQDTWEKMKPGLPKETRQYIPGLIAIHYVWTYRDKLAL